MNSVEDGPPEKTSLMEGEEGLGIEAEDEVSTETEVDGLLKQKAFWWTKRLFLGLLVTIGLAFLLSPVGGAALAGLAAFLGFFANTTPSSTRLALGWHPTMLAIIVPILLLVPVL